MSGSTPELAIGSDDLTLTIEELSVDLPFLAEPGRPTRFGKYVVTRHLTDGGMAEVYLARASGIEGFEKNVVIKRLKPELAQTFRLATELFLQEARIAATLEHPQIAQVYDVGVDEGSYFFAMEYVHGVDLRRLMSVAKQRQGQIRLEDSLRIVTELCGALHYAHEKRGANGEPLGLVHRDVSPANVLVSFDGAVKLCDFGVAEIAAARNDPNKRLFAGKFGYMSPEQCRAEPLDRQSDLFALAVVLYELTTLTPLFRAKSDREVVDLICSGKVRPPSQVRGKYPPELERIVMKGLSRDPTERYRTAQEMRLELEAVGRERKLALSAVGLTCLLRRIFPPELRQDTPTPTPSPLFDTPRILQAAVPRRAWRRRHRGWLVGAALAAATCAATFFLGAPPPGPAARDLAAGAERISARIESAREALETRARALAATPMLRAAIATDARTVRDMVARQALFSLAEGERVELIQRRGDLTTPLLRLPRRQEPRVEVDRKASRAAAVEVAADGRGLDLEASTPLVPLYRDKGLAGTLILGARLDGEALARELPAGLGEVRLRAPSGVLTLVPTARPAAVEVETVSIALEGVRGVAPLRLEVTKAVARPPRWLPVVRAASLGAALACALLFLIGRRRSRS